MNRMESAKQYTDKLGVFSSLAFTDPEFTAIK